MEATIVYWGYIGIIDEIWGLGFRVASGAFCVSPSKQLCYPELMTLPATQDSQCKPGPLFFLLARQSRSLEPSGPEP